MNTFLSRVMKYGLVMAAIISGLAAGLLMFSKHIGFEINWQGATAGLHRFGDDCHAASGPLRDDQVLSDVLAQPKTLTPFRIPYRGKEDPPPIPTKGYLYIRCQVDFSDLQPSGFAWLSLGPAFGETEVYINSELRYQHKEDTHIEFFILPKDRVKSAQIEIVSRNNSEGRPGLASLVPVTFGDNQTTFARMESVMQSWRAEQPALRIGYGFGLLLILALIWLVGAKYSDIGWMCILTASLIIRDSLSYRAAGEPASLMDGRLISIANMTIALSLAAFTVSFARIFSRHSGLMVAFIVAIGSYAVFALTIPQYLFFDLKLEEQMPAYTASFCMAIALMLGVQGLCVQSDLNRKRRQRLSMFLLAAFTAMILYFFQAMYGHKNGIFLAPFAHYLLATIFAIFLTIDVVLFQKEYFNERQKRINEERRSAVDRVLAAHTRTLAHDVRTPIRLAVSYFRSLSDRTQGTSFHEVVTGYQNDIDGAAAFVEGMLADVMFLGSRAMDGDKLVFPGLLGRKTLENIINLYPSKNLSLNLTSNDSLQVKANSQRLERVLYNLGENAAQATPTGGSLWLRVITVDHNFVSIVVGNSGSYIPPEERERIFEPYYTKKQQGGTGLGLMIAKDTITALGGTIEVRSSREAGTEFECRLPIAAGDVSLNPSQKIQNSSGGNTAAESKQDSLPTVALIEDNIYVQQEWLRSATDFRLSQYYSPQEFMIAWGNDSSFLARFQCIIADVHFRTDLGMNGKEFIHTLLANGAGDKLLVMSNLDTTDLSFGPNVRLVTKRFRNWKEMTALI